MTQIAIVVYPGFTALDFIGPYEVLRNLPDAPIPASVVESSPSGASRRFASTESIFLVVVDFVSIEKGVRDGTPDPPNER